MFKKENSRLSSKGMLNIYTKSDYHLLKQNYYICFSDCPSQMMKYAFYFILKALFIFKICLTN